MSKIARATVGLGGCFYVLLGCFERQKGGTRLPIHKQPHAPLERGEPKISVYDFVDGRTMRDSHDFGRV